ncbi:MAG: nitrogenase associated protein N [Peptococcaceae bacterium]|jgi:light-independent protochlorophyllide reductase B subunit|nr:nitrogenase associated protein N [Peptococcaceae bacterium]
MYQRLTFAHTTHSKDPLLSCALEGVASVVAGIRDVSIVIHSPQGCASTVNAAYDKHEMDQTQRKIACTRLFESDIIMGATEKLEKIIRQAEKNFAAQVMFVVGTCSADIIGEDIAAVCRNLQPEVSAKLIPVIAGGFRGHSNIGIDLGFNALLPLVEPSAMTMSRTVNLIAPQASANASWQSDWHWVKSVLTELGIEVIATLAHDATLEEVAKAGQAQANILLSHDAGYGFARQMEKIHHVPLILADLPLPIGLTNTARWIRGLCKHFELDGQAEPIIERQEDFVTRILRKRGLMMIPRYRNCKIALSADMTMGIGMLRMLYLELEMIPELLLFKSTTPLGEALLERELESLGIAPRVVLNADGYQVQEALKNADVDLVIGSAWEKYIAEELGIQVCFDVLAPSNRVLYVSEPYFGYEGMLYLLQAFANDWERALRSKHIAWENEE